MMLSANKTKLTWPIIGHKTSIEYLSKCILSRKVVPAYLFFGPEHIGKTAVAHNFVQILLCTDNNKKPCGLCINCKKIVNRSHPDIIYLEKTVNKKNISIEDIRKNIIHRLQLSSLYNSYKVAIIDGAEFLSIEAANSLLKTLEEPTKNTLLILIAHQPENIPRTLLSRCQLIEFQTVSTDDIIDYINKELPSVDRTSALEIARLSNGRPGITWQYLHIPEFLEERKNQVSDFISLLQADLPTKFSFIGELASSQSFQGSAESVNSAIELWKVVLRDMLLLHYDLLPSTINYFKQEALIKIKNRYKPRMIHNLLSYLHEIQKGMRFNINPRLAIENFFLKF